MFGCIDVARPQIRGEQLVTTKHIQRQEAVAVIIAVKETPLLIAMHGRVGRVKIQDQHRRRFLVRGNELLHQLNVHRPSGRSRLTVLEPAQRGCACQFALTPGRHLVDDVMP